MAPRVAWNWPEDMVDATRLCEILGYRTGDPDVIGDEAATQVSNLEAAVERARISGRVKRLSAKNPTTGEVAAYGYRRADVRRVVGMD
jgi:hypothetical protein